jgi:hypothetical protein
MPFMPECLPTRPEDIGATPPFQWLDKGWCEERCLNRVWQPRGGRK